MEPRPGLASRPGLEGEIKFQLPLWRRSYGKGCNLRRLGRIDYQAKYVGSPPSGFIERVTMVTREEE
jgi:hypothetical protein